MIKVLIVEDEDFIRKGLIGTFDWVSSDCVVVGEAENGLEGLKKIEEVKPNVVITDIKMPKMNGIEMVRKAKEICDFETLILSSYNDFDYAKQAIDLRVFDYIVKPIDDEYLKNSLLKVKKLVDEKQLFYKLRENIKDVKSISLINLENYTSGALSDKYTEKIIEYILQNYSKKISIEEFAEKYNISTSYLSRQFKLQTSHTFHDFLNKYRIQKSIEILDTGEYKVYEVSYMVGFSEYKHFSSVFKKYMKYSPSEFLKKCTNRT
ncbi:DNA-binding response regulator [Clostridium beijerinckii]|nr:DNA-binding response regulator [Clostridium beijerinckii]